MSDPSQELTPQIEAAIKAKWQKIVGPDVEIVVSITNYNFQEVYRESPENKFNTFSIFLKNTIFHIGPKFKAIKS